MVRQFFPKVLKEQKGITGLEVAIVLIAFVVVSSVFAFAALSTGLFTAERAEETTRSQQTSQAPDCK